ncbi:unnamed protein product [Kuraishia capsulata CBS 1993]|uniref:S1 motif domain-containing protein n=1 Tax=Kuraishia capsulata CBS 1993 TaxID=1382522 RepID=W6MX94_9ASCO|nr:uncharacterized protein KUCA_T00004478001 [Kuraishia capsulata CBS 1993]CDK28495.1 unnamed protein product [Kuraishia capsulata CBS 1993]
MISAPEKVVPGQPIVPILPDSVYEAGEGASMKKLYANNELITCIVSNKLGKVITQEKDGKTIISVVSVGSGSNKITTPKVGDIVIAKVVRITGTRALCDIYSIETATGTGLINSVLAEGVENFRGVVRSQDIRSTNRDSVKLVECFKPGDIIRAQVISLGDGRDYFLTTSRNDLGVIFAKSNGGAGQMMLALDWQTMVCPETGKTEKRKCAKPF